MPNPALTEKIRNLPPLLDSLERDAEVSDLLRRSDAARERFRQMFPLDGVEQSAFEDYRKEWMARYVYNSNAIEGSTLTLEDTELVLEGEFLRPTRRQDTSSPPVALRMAWPMRNDSLKRSGR